MNQLRIGIIGGAGYVGGEMIRLLLHHDLCKIVYISSKSQAGKQVHSIHSDLNGWTDLKFQEEKQIDVDVIFLCMGHGKSKEYLKKMPVKDDCIIIDLSRDFRLNEDRNDFIYGLCELNKEKIKKSKRIANPGCFATCIQLGLLPLAANHQLESEVHVTAITGSTGAGQNPIPTTHNSWRNNNISIYKAFNHQHLGEIVQSLSQLQPGFKNNVNFIPMRGSFTRGIFASIYLDSELSEEAAIDIFKSYYETSPFIHISDIPISVKNVVNTNNGIIHIARYGQKLRIESAIDNLLKGASGQAVQNLNLVMNWPETMGLKLKASAF